MDTIRQLIFEAMYTDGGHHKQWYLNEIRKVLGIEFTEKELNEYGEIDEGIAP